MVRMRRCAPRKAVEPWRPRVDEPEASPLWDRLSRWSRGVQAKATDYWPDMLEGITDRRANTWEALMTVADCWPVDIGPRWPGVAL